MTKTESKRPDTDCLRIMLATCYGWPRSCYICGLGPCQREKAAEEAEALYQAQGEAVRTQDPFTRGVAE